MEIHNDCYCVYVHINKINGKMYVGQTCKKPEERWAKGNGYINCTRFYRAIKKYGWDNFEHEIIASNLTLEEANCFEEMLIGKLNTTNPDFGYNLQSGGENRKCSEETKQKISNSHKGKKFTSEHIEKMIDNHIGFLGRKHSQETKIKMSKSQFGSKNHNYGKFGENNPISCYINQYDKNGNFINTWVGSRQIERDLGFDHSSIIRCCRGKIKSFKGFVWYYADNPTQPDPTKIIPNKMIKEEIVYEQEIYNCTR